LTHSWLFDLGLFSHFCQLGNVSYIICNLLKVQNHHHITILPPFWTIVQSWQF
jgi:hypothetical protein